MRNPGPTYNLNDPAIELDKIIDRLTPARAIEHANAFIQDDTIIIYLGDIPEQHREHRNIARYATEAWAEIIGYQVLESEIRDNAHIVFRLAPREGEVLQGYGGIVTEDGVVIAEEFDPTDDKIQLTSVYLHEIGHVLGLRHPHEIYTPENGTEIDYLPGDSDLTSVMSYVLDSANAITPGVNSMNLTPALADIIAIQRLYTEEGTQPVQVNHSDSVYGYHADIERKVTDGEPVSIEEQNWYRFTHPGLYLEVNDFGPRMTIYDTGGIDTLNLSNEGPGNPGEIQTHRGEFIEIISWIRGDDGEILPIITGQTVNLNPGWTSNVYGGQANLVIANDTMIENVIAGEGGDKVIGNSADNRLEGRHGNDILIGGPGADTLVGGPDDDTLEGGPGADTLMGGDGNDAASYSNSPTAVIVRLHNLNAQGDDTLGDTFPNLVEVTWTDSDGVEQIESLPDIENLTGSAFDDTLAGDRRDNVLRGNAGNDTLYGGPGGGDDILAGGAGDDKLYGGQGNDILESGPGSDTLIGGPGSDTASYTESTSAVTVRLHNDQAVGGDAVGDSFLKRIEVAWTDADGVEHTDSLPDVENLTGSAYDDTLAGDRRDNVIKGSAGNDTLFGGPGGGDDTLAGEAGDDILFGGVGEDKLTGGKGNDRLSGGPGEDVFVFVPGGYEDTIVDFTLGEDKIDLTAFELDNIEHLVLLTIENKVMLDSFLLSGVSVILENLTDPNISEDHFIV